MTSYILPVDKPAGPTSHDIVASARRALKERRIGHTGTLDPFASGLLLLCVGQATRLAEYLAGMRKQYQATARLDGTTTTDDLTGEMIQQSDSWQQLDGAAVAAAFEAQRGELLQVPSTFSAKKLAGERAYDRARRGEAVELEPVRIHVYQLEVTRIELPEVDFTVTCSAGTYVRAIARDAGRTLGSGGYLSALRRTRVGEFDVSTALAPKALESSEAVQRAAVPMAQALGDMPVCEIDEAQERALRFGQRIVMAAPEETVGLTRAGELVAIGRKHDDGIRPLKVFPRD